MFFTERKTRSLVCRLTRHISTKFDSKSDLRLKQMKHELTGRLKRGQCLLNKRIKNICKNYIDSKDVILSQIRNIFFRIGRRTAVLSKKFETFFSRFLGNLWKRVKAIFPAPKIVKKINFRFILSFGCVRLSKYITKLCCSRFRCFLYQANGD